MRSLATLGGVLVLIVLAIAWKISNQVEAGQEPDKNTGRVTLGVLPEDGETPPTQPASGNPGSGATENPGSLPAADTPETSGQDPAPLGGEQNQPRSGQDKEPSEPAPPPAQPSAPATQPESTPPAPPVDEEIAGLRYTVKEGDTLYSILMRAYGKANDALIDAVAVASDLDDPGRLSPGMILVLPQVSGYAAPKQP
ncbi:MAG: hypothetical protein CMJ94_12585 [Planctomycetes bacterium]|nr:hypothetical protein [Planctomycetota bacterium]